MRKKSFFVSNTPGMVVKKLGQPVPDSNFISEVKSGRSHPAQAKMPARFSSLSGLEPACSVPSLRITRYDIGDRRLDHSWSDSFTGSVADGTVAPAGRKDFQFFCSSSTVLMFLGPAARVAKGAAARAKSNARRFILISFCCRCGPWSL